MSSVLMLTKPKASTSVFITSEYVKTFYGPAWGFLDSLSPDEYYNDIGTPGFESRQSCSLVRLSNCTIFQMT